MFYLLLGINAWTDWREGYVYDCLSLILFGYCLWNRWMTWTVYAAGMLIFLAGLRLWDRQEKLLGRGDYLILLSVSLQTGEALPLVLTATSAAALITAGLTGKKQVPLIPCLWLGTLLAWRWL